MPRRAHSMEMKSFDGLSQGLDFVEFKSSEDGSIEGYGAIFGNIDRGRDVVNKGAFSESLKTDHKVKMLWQHDPYQPIGVWDEVYEDEKGLRVKGKILADVKAGQEAAALVKAGAINGLSIGYRVLEFSEEKVDGSWVRYVEKAELWEVSLVTFPMNPVATLDAKTAAGMSQREFERQLLRESKMSRKVVDALMRDGFKGVHALSDSGGEYFSELLEAMQAASLKKSLLSRGN